jgi:hypothetical protein
VHEEGEPFTVADDSRMGGIAMHAGKLAFDAIEAKVRFELPVMI